MRLGIETEYLAETGIQKYAQVRGEAAATSLRSQLRSIANISCFNLLRKSDLLMPPPQPSPKDFESRLVSLFI